MTQTEKINEGYKKAINSILHLQALIGPCSPMGTNLYKALDNLIIARGIYLARETHLTTELSLKESNKIINQILKALTEKCDEH